MITQENFADLLKLLDFRKHGKMFSKTINGHELKADFANQKLIYPAGITAERETTKNFSQNENFVVFECVHNLLAAGYKPEHITLEPKTVGGREDTSFYCDILIKNNDGEEYLLIECKTTDTKNSEFDKAWKRMQKDGGQLFNYFNSYRKAQYLCLYAADWTNGGIEQSYRLVSMKDNDKYLESDNRLKSYKSVREESGSKADFFQVWQQTYQLDSTENNLFESAPFRIGTRPFATSDLKEVDSLAIQKKYHRFATIMRQHNVSGRENAFDKLVNIFLAKIKDESENPDNLKVYWKGAAQDNYFDLQDRLQELYKKGMDEFLGEEITHVTNDEIEDAFVLFKNKKDETKRTILEKFKEIKYYTNNDFAFLDVHNRPLFFKNGAILKEVVQMLQDIKLKTDGSGQNQFLGDLFEGFLDQGVKQSEGQFFTPMPIVRFLVSSLPLENLIQNSESVPKMIDYACGSGHFLNEYATQIRPIVTQYKNTNPEPYYAAAYGIEKEYRLSKVAKVSAFMYGQDGINIVYGDGLTEHADIQNGTFSVLVANPPYSVKGFLDTLSEEEREAFKLYQSVKETDTFNAIETFFIERAAQLLSKDGIAAIILPSSVLSNGNIYIKTREILLQRFDVVAIAEFGSRTFGKTGTNTVTLFLRRKGDAPSLAEHYQNRVDYWFDGDREADGLFEDKNLLVRYCNHCGISESEYLDFLKSKKLPENGIFADYRAEYEKSSDWEAIQKKRDFKKKNGDEKQAEFEKRAFDFAAGIEKDKLRYFMLATANPQPVLIIKSPSENKAAKAFLGYEWSARKGSEGIKYIGSGETEDEDNPNRNQGIFKMQTPLFNPNDLADSGKLNHLIRQNFQTALTQKQPEIPEHLKTFASLRPLHEMLDFSRTEFDKAVQTALAEKVEIVSKYPFEPIGKIAPHIESGKRPSGGVGFNTSGAYSLGGEHINKDNGHLELKSVKYVPKAFYDNATKGKIRSGDILLCKDGALTGKVALVRDELNGILAMANEHIFVIRCAEENTQKYLFHVLHSEIGQQLLKENTTGAAQGGLNSTNFKNIRIPLPTTDVQNQIISECQKIDREYETSRMSIEAYRAKIAQIFSDLGVMAQTQPQGGVKLFKIKELCISNPSKQTIKSLSDDLMVSFVEMAAVNNDGYIESKIDRKLGDLRKGSYTYFAENDIILAKITPCMENGKCALATGLTNKIGMGSSEFHILRSRSDNLENAFLFYFLNRSEIRTAAEQRMTGASGHRRVPIAFYEDLDIPVPPLAEQQTILAQIADYEAEIAKLEQNLQSLPARKQAVLEKYLN